MIPEWILQPCPLPSAAHAEAARARQAVLTKPAGSLGRLEQIAVELAALQSTDRPRAAAARIVVFAADHGVTARGVSAYPAEVTVEMLANFARGGAAIAVLARELGAPLEIVDAGTLALEAMPGVVEDKPCRGTRDFTQGPAMSASELAHALDCGRRAVSRAAAAKPDLLILGEMGIGNTTAAAALAAAITGLPARELVGEGTGVGTAGIGRKADVIERAIALHGLTHDGTAFSEAGARTSRALAAVGGLEIAALAGAMIAAAQVRIPVLIDGFIVSAAALAAVALNPSSRSWLLFSHTSAERGHAALLSVLGAQPVLALDLRLGEASGAAIALPILRLACALHNGMATFAESAVSGRIEP